MFPERDEKKKKTAIFLLAVARLRSLGVIDFSASSLRWRKPRCRFSDVRLGELARAGNISAPDDGVERKDDDAVG